MLLNDIIYFISNFKFIFTKSKSFKNGKKIEMFFQSTIIVMQ